MSFLIDSLTAVFGKGKDIPGVGIMFGGFDTPPTKPKRNPKSNCDGCDKTRVLGFFQSGGDSFCYCYNCANHMYGHTYTSSKMSRRKFYEHVGNN
jgi:hypothetical protein